MGKRHITCTEALKSMGCNQATWNNCPEYTSRFLSQICRRVSAPFFMVLVFTRLLKLKATETPSAPVFPYSQIQSGSKSCWLCFWTIPGFLSCPPVQAPPFCTWTTQWLLTSPPLLTLTTLHCLPGCQIKCIDQIMQVMPLPRASLVPEDEPNSFRPASLPDLGTAYLKPFLLFSRWLSLPGVAASMLSLAPQMLPHAQKILLEDLQVICPFTSFKSAQMPSPQEGLPSPS